MDEEGQSLVFVVVSLTVLLLMLALVLDVGSWLRAHRQLQTVADAAALASVQELPFDPAAAGSKVNEYAQLNWPGIADPTVTISPSNASEITVTVERNLPGFFASLAGIGNVTATARATALVQASTTLNNADFSSITDTPAYVAPLVINADSACSVAACFGSATTLTFDAGTPQTGRFGFANISCPGNCGPPPVPRARTFGRWITCSPSSQCVPGDILSGSDFTTISPGIANSNRVRNAMNAISGKILILPVFDTASPSSYHVVGFSAFAVTSVDWDNTNPIRTISGNFVKYTTPGAVSASPSTNPDYGVQVIGLTS